MFFCPSATRLSPHKKKGEHLVYSPETARNPGKSCRIEPDEAASEKPIRAGGIAMEHFIPYEKLSKRERKARDAERRISWGMSPVTRRPRNPRAYNRRKTRMCIEDA